MTTKPRSPHMQLATALKFSSLKEHTGLEGQIISLRIALLPLAWWDRYVVTGDKGLIMFAWHLLFWQFLKFQRFGIMKYHILTTVSVLWSSHCGAEKNATWKQAAASLKSDFYNEYGQSIVQFPLPLTFFKCFTAAFLCRTNV